MLNIETHGCRSYLLEKTSALRDGLEFPVPVKKLSEKLGGVVFEVEWSNKLVKAFCLTDKRVIVLNSNQNEEQKRFDLAHELGHFVLQEVVDNYHERCLNRFAAELLMPERHVFWLKGRYSIAMMARFFGVTYNTMKKRVLGLTDEAAQRKSYQKIVCPNCRLCDSVACS